MSKLPDSLEVTGDLTVVDVDASGSVNAADITLTGGVSGVTGAFTTSTTTPKVIITSDTSACPWIVAASHAPEGTDYAYPGTIWILTTATGAAGSTAGNAMVYMNTSASGASGSTWTLMNALFSGG